MFSHEVLQLSATTSNNTLRCPRKCGAGNLPQIFDFCCRGCPLGEGSVEDVEIEKTEWKLHLCCCCSTMLSSAHPMVDGPETSRSFSGNTREAPFRKSLQIPQVEQCNQRGSLARADDPEAIDPTMVRQTGLVQKPINLVHFWKWGGRRSS